MICCDKTPIDSCPNECTTFAEAKNACRMCDNRSCDFGKCIDDNGKKGWICGDPVLPSPSVEEDEE